MAPVSTRPPKVAVSSPSLEISQKEFKSTASFSIFLSFVQIAQQNKKESCKIGEEKINDVDVVDKSLMIDILGRQSINEHLNDSSSLPPLLFIATHAAFEQRP